MPAKINGPQFKGQLVGDRIAKRLATLQYAGKGDPLLGFSNRRFGERRRHAPAPERSVLSAVTGYLLFGALVASWGAVTGRFLIMPGLGPYVAPSGANGDAADGGPARTGSLSR